MYRLLKNDKRGIRKMLKKENVLKLAVDSLTENRFIERNSNIFNRAKLFDIITILGFATYLGFSYFYLTLTQMIFFCIIPLVAYFIINSDKDFKNPLTYTRYFENFIIKELDKKYGINLEGVDFNFVNFYDSPLRFIEQYFNNLDLDEIEFASLYYIEKLRLDPENKNIEYSLNEIIEKIKKRKLISEKNAKHYGKMLDLGVNVEFIDKEKIKG